MQKQKAALRGGFLFLRSGSRRLLGMDGEWRMRVLEISLVVMLWLGPWAEPKPRTELRAW